MGAVIAMSGVEARIGRVRGATTTSSATMKDGRNLQSPPQNPPVNPQKDPSKKPSKNPSKDPSKKPSKSKKVKPTSAPTTAPTVAPTSAVITKDECDVLTSKATGYSWCVPTSTCLAPGDDRCAIADCNTKSGSAWCVSTRECLPSTENCDPKYCTVDSDCNLPSKCKVIFGGKYQCH